MKNTLLVLLTVLTTFSLSSQVPEKAEDVSPLLVGETIPNANLIDKNGDEIALKKIIKEKSMEKKASLIKKSIKDLLKKNYQYIIYIYTFIILYFYHFLDF